MTKIKVQYIGLRVFGGDELIDVFLYEGKELKYSRSKSWLRIGYYYEAKKHPDPKGIQITNRPAEVGEFDGTDAQLKKWQFEDAGARQFQKRLRAVKQHERRPEILKIVEALKPLVKDMYYSDKKALLEFMLDKLEGEIKTEVSAKTRKIIDRIYKSSARAVSRAEKDLEKEKAKNAKTK